MPPAAQDVGSGFEIGRLAEGEVGDVLRLIRALADYEKLGDQVIATEDALRTALFGQPPQVEAIVARVGGRVVGFALYFRNYSTFRARGGVYLEDLFVEPQYRGQGLGRALLRQVAAVALGGGCERFEWAVLDWNQPAIDFYTGLGAKALSDWTVYRLSGEALSKLATPE